MYLLVLNLLLGHEVTVHEITVTTDSLINVTTDNVVAGVSCSAV